MAEPGVARCNGCDFAYPETPSYIGQVGHPDSAAAYRRAAPHPASTMLPRLKFSSTLEKFVP